MPGANHASIRGRVDALRTSRDENDQNANMMIEILDRIGRLGATRSARPVTCPEGT